MFTTLSISSVSPPFLLMALGGQSNWPELSNNFPTMPGYRVEKGLGGKKQQDAGTTGMSVSVAPRRTRPYQAGEAKKVRHACPHYMR